MKPMTICFDFDGVLCEYEGWKGHDKIGKPILGMIVFVKRLHEEGHTLKLSTTRLNPYPFGENAPDKYVQCGGARTLINEWLVEQGIKDCFSEITGYKPHADYYIDDRAIRYSPMEKDIYGGKLGVDLYHLFLDEE